MRFFHLFIVFISTIFLVYSEIPSVLPAFEGEPSANVDSCVSAISGAYYVAEPDILIPGRQPIMIPRILIRQEFHGCVGGWCFFPQIRLEEVIDSYSSKKKGKTRKTISVRDSTGSQIFYVAKYKNEQVFYPTEESFKGFTNTSRGSIGGRSNQRNHKVIYDGVRYILHLPDGTERQYKLDKNSDNYKYPSTKTRDFKLSCERLPNGNWLRYKYDETSGIKYICSTNPDKTKVYAWAEIDSKDFQETGIVVRTSDGHIYQYFYENNGEKTCLCRVTKNGTPLEGITYQDNKSWQVQGRNFCGKRRTKAKYYSEEKVNIVAGKTIKVKRGDHRFGRVKYLKMPKRNGNEMQVTKSFFYHFPKDEKGNKENMPDWTQVVDALGNQVTYHYTDDQILVGTDYFDKKYGHLLYERSIFDNQGKILIKLYKNAKEKTELARTYKYDNRGNVLEDTLYGNFTGMCKQKIVLDKRTIKANGIECNKTTYEYNSRNLITKKTESNGRVTEYRYLPKTNHLLAEYTLNNNKITCRKIIAYGKDNLILSEMIDDGSSYIPTDTEGVTEKKITRYTYWAKEPALHLPKTVENWYSQDGQECLLGRVELNYNQSCQVTKKSVYDADGRYRYSEEYRYDREGNQIYTKDPLGKEITATYDQFGNKYFEQEEATKLRTDYKYNKHNQQTKKVVENPKTGELLEEKIYYDASGRVSTKSDFLNNKTLFSYDMFGNVRETTTPVNYKLIKTYNFQGKCTEAVDANGNTTKTTYNARGKPITIIYPDETKERYVYDIHGQVKRHIDRLGRITTTKYDLDHRPIEIERRSAQGELLHREQNTFNAFHLISKKNHLNIQTIYQYDGAGRKIEEKCITPEGSITTYTDYDSLSRPHRITTEADNCLPQIKRAEYDLLGRIVQQTIEDKAGKIYQKTTCEYDEHSNKNKIVTHIGDQESIETNEYDLFDRLVGKTNALDHSIKISYKRNKTQKNKPSILQKITTEINRKTTETYDALGRVTTREITNKENEQVFYEKYDYDGKNQLIQQTSCIQPQNQEKVTLFSYDTNGNLTQFTEAHGTQEERITTYTYNAEGKQLTHIKPDGTILTKTYDSYGREKTLTSSQGDIAYELTYDLYGNLIKAKDLVQNTTTKRKASLFGHIQKETLANGITIRNTTDLLGNCLKTQLPDKTYITYSYDTYNLREIARYNQTNERQYSHKYDQYDLTGNPREQTLIFDLGKQIHQFDLLNREIIRSSPFHQETYDQFDPNGNLLTRTLSLEKSSSTYTYDTLDQLTQETGPWESTYTTDSHHNRLTKNEQEYETGLLNQLQTAHANNYTYDPNGNPTTKNQTQYEYDSLDRLIRVTTPSKTHTYTYDYFHRRITKDNSHYIYDGENEIGRETNGKIDQLRILGLGRGAEIGSAIAIELSDKIYLPLHSIRGDIIALIDPQTKQFASYTSYNAFGEHNQKGPCPWRFQSKRHDPETNFTYFGRRYYEPETGRFFTPDPKGQTEIFSLYNYVQNNPLILLDLYGLEVENGLNFLRVLSNPCTNIIFESEKVVESLEYAQRISSGVSHGMIDFAYSHVQDAETLAFHTGLLANDSLLDFQERTTLLSNFQNKQAGDLEKLETLVQTHLVSDLDDPVYKNSRIISRVGCEVAPIVLAGYGIAKNISKTPRLVNCAIKTEYEINRLCYKKTAGKHLSELVLKGEHKGLHARSYMKSLNTVNEIMQAGKPLADPGGIPNALKWNVSGTCRGSSGIWELVIDVENQIIYHFLFNGKK